jgi:hypothetical protein
MEDVIEEVDGGAYRTIGIRALKGFIVEVGEELSIWEGGVGIECFCVVVYCGMW